MSIDYIEYDLQDGFIANWLSAGPQIIPVEPIPGDPTACRPEAIARRYFDPKPRISTQPVERGPLNKGLFQIDSYTGEWHYTRCGADHLVDHSITCPGLSYLRSWAYVRLVSPAAQTVQFSLLSQGPADVWINNKPACHTEAFSAQPLVQTFTARLVSGANKLLLRFAGVAAPDCALAVGLRVSAVPATADGLKVRIPSLIPSLNRRNELEAVNEGLYLDRDIYAAGEQIFLCWPDGMEKPAYQDMRLQTPGGRIYGMAEDVGKPGDRQMLGAAATLAQGEYRALVLPRAWEFYESNIRITKELSLYVSGLDRFSIAPYGDLTDRRREALTHAAYYEDNLHAGLARMGLGVWKSVEPVVFETAAAQVARRETGSEMLLLGLLGGMLRFGKHPGFPGGLSEQVKAAALGFRYAPSAAACDALTFDLETRQIIFHACAILAGQLYPTAVFSDGGLSGKKLRQQGEAAALAWMRERAARGFSAWDSTEGYAETLFALSYLIDLAKTEAVWELASVLMDKIFFSIALNSYKGVFGGSQGRAGTPDLKGGMLQATAAITRLMWGIGMYNNHLPALVSLALMEKYELPPILAEIAYNLPEVEWNRAQSAGEGQVANTAAYRTPDYMLAAVQDYHPGEPGRREHIWQATLGTKAVVFSNHPGCATHNDAHTPNFWLGNASLPRVAQHQDTLIALYHLPESALIRYTHAYFPVIEFDEYRLEHNTAFARLGDGYLALTAAGGLEMVESGPTAFRELRSPGLHNAWICQMGRAALDGDFASFQARILANPPRFDSPTAAGMTAAATTQAGQKIAFSWEGPLTLDGAEVALSGYPHFDNPYTYADLPARQMEIRTAGYLLRLNFAD